MRWVVAPDSETWDQAHAVAEPALRGSVMTSVGEATHYHADYVAPSWAPRLIRVRRIGAHIFYRWPGGWGEPATFDGRYAGAEHLVAARGMSPGVAVAEAVHLDAREGQAVEAVAIAHGSAAGI